MVCANKKLFSDKLSMGLVAEVTRDFPHTVITAVIPAVSSIPVTTSRGSKTILNLATRTLDLLVKVVLAMDLGLRIQAGTPGHHNLAAGRRHSRVKILELTAILAARARKWKPLELRVGR